MEWTLIRLWEKLSGCFMNVHTIYFRATVSGLIKVDLEFNFSIPGLFQTWNSNKPGFEKLNSRSEPVFEKLNSRSELELSKKAIIN